MTEDELHHDSWEILDFAWWLQKGHTYLKIPAAER